MFLKFDMITCSDVATPMNSSFNLKFPEGYFATINQVKQYQTIVESFIYLSTQTKPDIAYAI